MGIRVDLMETIIRSVISPTLIAITNDNYKPNMERENLKLLSTVLLHILNLIFAYAPVYGLVEFVKQLDAYKSTFSFHAHGLFTLIYLASIGVYLLIDILFKKYGSPWRYLLVEPVDEKDVSKTNDVTLHDDDDQHISDEDLNKPDTSLRSIGGTNATNVEYKKILEQIRTRRS